MNSKTIIKTSIFTFILISFLSVGVLAATGQFAFIFSSTYDAQYSTFQPKADNEKRAYITTVSGNIDQTTTWVRFNIRSGTDSASRYTPYTRSYYTQTVDYLSGNGYAGYEYRLRGQDDVGNGVVTGRWTP